MQYVDGTGEMRETVRIRICMDVESVETFEGFGILTLDSFQAFNWNPKFRGGTAWVIPLITNK